MTGSGGSDGSRIFTFAWVCGGQFGGGVFTFPLVLRGV